MYEFSGTFGSSLVPVQIQPTGQHGVKMVDFFGIKSFNSGVPIYSLTGYHFGVHIDRLPYFVQTGARVSVNYRTNNVEESRRNFYVKGQNGDGYYGIFYN